MTLGTDGARELFCRVSNQISALSVYSFSSSREREHGVGLVACAVSNHSDVPSEQVVSSACSAAMGMAI